MNHTQPPTLIQVDNSTAVGIANKSIKQKRSKAMDMGYKHGDKSFYRIFCIGIPYLLMNLISCRGFFKNINYVVILKFPKSMLE